MRGRYVRVRNENYNLRLIRKSIQRFNEDDKAYQKCQPIFQEIERDKKEEQLIKVFGNRGVVLEEYDFRDD